MPKRAIVATLLTTAALALLLSFKTPQVPPLSVNSQNGGNPNGALTQNAVNAPNAAGTIAAWTVVSLRSAASAALQTLESRSSFMEPQDRPVSSSRNSRRRASPGPLSCSQIWYTKPSALGRRSSD